MSNKFFRILGQILWVIMVIGVWAIFYIQNKLSRQLDRLEIKYRIEQLNKSTNP